MVPRTSRLRSCKATYLSVMLTVSMSTSFAGVFPWTGKNLMAAEAPPREADSADADSTGKALAIAWGPFLQNLTPQSVTVLWTAGATTEGVLEYGESKNQLEQRLISPLGKDHQITIPNLKPGKTYYYQVSSTSQDGRSTATSTIGSFATPLDDAEHFSFAILGDTHQYSRAAELADRIRDEAPHFVLHLGDRNPSIVAGLLRPYGEVMQRLPMYLARGNHDSVEKQQQFSAMPGPGNELYYSFRWGNARFFCVDTNDRRGLKKDGQHYKWLEDELSATRETWKFVFQHIPVYSAWDGRMNRNLDDERALLEKHNVHVVFQGHMHNYDRSYPLRDNKVVKEDGVIYVTASGGCGGQEKFPHPHRPWFIAKQWRGEPFIGMCTLSESRATIQFMTSKGLLFDTLELRAR